MAARRASVFRLVSPGEGKAGAKCVGSEESAVFVGRLGEDLETIPAAR
jgi:hypothetical protein